MSGLAGFVGKGDSDQLEEMLALLGGGEPALDIPAPNLGLAVVMPAHASTHVATLGDPPLALALASDTDLTVAGLTVPMPRSGARCLDADLAAPPASAPVLWAIAAAYRADPRQFAARLEGRFALALHDPLQQRLVLACDRSGAKTIFWTQVAGTLHFATALKSLLAVPGVERRLDEIALDEFLAQGFTGGTRSLFTSIHRLPPGHELIHERGCTTVRPYWLPAAADRPPSRSDQVEQLGDLLAESVRARLTTHGTAGCFLNGSVDSSLVLALLSEHSASRVQTFAVDWAGSDGDREASRRIAGAFGTDHHELEMGAPSSLDLIELTWLLDLPVSTPSVFATYALSGLAREHVSRVFSGQGASQLFGRRPGHGPPSTPGPLSGLRALLARLPGCRHLRAVSPDAASEPPLFDAHARHALYSLDLRGRIARRIAQRDSDGPDEELPLGATGPVRGSKPLKLGRATRAQRVDLELPYLDPRVIDWAGRLTADPARGQLVARNALREVARRSLPEWVVHREGRKRALPIAAWLRGPLSSFAGVLLGEVYVRRQGLFDPLAINALCASLRTGGLAVAAQLWRLMAFQLWYVIFVEDEDRARELISKARQTDRIPVRSGTPMPPVRV